MLHTQIISLVGKTIAELKNELEELKNELEELKNELEELKNKNWKIPDIFEKAQPA